MLKPIRTYLFTVMFFVFYGIYANADERRHELGTEGQTSRFETQDFGFKTPEMTLESTGDTKYTVNNDTNRANILDSLTRHVDSLNKWISLSFDKEKRGLYFRVPF